MKHAAAGYLRCGIAAVLILVAAISPFVLGGVRVGPPSGTAASGGANPQPIPPKHVATLGVLRVPTLINVTSGSSSGPWVVHVRDAFGLLISTGVTDRSGDVVQVLPTLPGLRLDVIGTDAVDVPVVAGTVLEIWLP